MKFRLPTLLVMLILTIFSCSNHMEELMQESYGKGFHPPANFVYIPNGELHLSKTEKISMPSFFMQKSEVPNFFYAEFLSSLLKQGRTEDHKKASLKPENWVHRLNMGTYSKHPVYEYYPVVTVSKEGAEMYCKWLGESWKDRYPEYHLDFRLPTEEEWMYAARGGHDYAPYSWGGWYLRNAKGKMLANFRGIGAGNIHYDRKNNTYEVMTPDNWFFPSHNVKKPIIDHLPAPTISYFPNDFGLYNMCGNVSEMLSTNTSSGGHRTKGGCYDSTGWDIRIGAEDEFEGWTEPSQFIGFRPVLVVTKK